MNNKRILFLVIITLAMATNVNAEWKFGISAGLSNIDYDLVEKWADAGVDISTEGASSSDDVDTWFNSKGYGAMELVFDFRNGPHAISYKIANGSVSGWEDSEVLNGTKTDWDAAGFTSRSSNVDREEWTFSYAYTFGDHWTVSAGLYDGTLDYDYERAWRESYNEGTVYEDFWTGSTNRTKAVTSEGAFLAIAYSNKISEKVFWFAKLGYQASDIKTNTTYDTTETYSATDSYWNDSGIEYFYDNYGMIDGTYAYTRNRIRESEGEATVIGLGLVYAFNVNDSITLEYESKSYSMDPAEETVHTCTGFTYICDQASISTAQMMLEEEASYLTLRYRHSF